MDLRGEGILVLGIDRHHGGDIGAPTRGTRITAGDRLLLYGRATDLVDLDTRRRDRSGEERHRRSLDRHRQVVEEERREDESSGP